VLRKLVQQHFHKTGSARARTILAQWDAYRVLFRKVAPPALAVVETVAQLQPTESRA
jgi:glutamate synthase domain-containing protein 3